MDFASSLRGGNLTRQEASSQDFGTAEVHDFFSHTRGVK